MATKDNRSSRAKKGATKKGATKKGATKRAEKAKRPSAEPPDEAVFLSGFSNNGDEANVVPLGPRLRTRRREMLRFNAPDLGAWIGAYLRYDDDTGRYETERLDIWRYDPDAPRMNVLLRKLNLPSLVDQHGAEAIDDWLETEVDGEWRKGIYPRFDDESEEEFVARAYRMSLLFGMAPVRGVSILLGVTEAVASQKVWLARKLGLLPMTEPGKAKA
jgi:hypothetical protein